MQKTFVMAVTLFLLASAPTKAQDALGTFMFIFLDQSTDVTRNYGDEFATTSDLGNVRITTTVNTPSKCIFQRTKTEKIMQTAEHKILSVERWNFNKAFFDETKIVRRNYGNYDLEAIISGDKGFYSRCNGDNNCSGEEETFSRIVTDRSIKALKYFAQNFCPGTKRKSAF